MTAAWNPALPTRAVPGPVLHPRAPDSCVCHHRVHEHHGAPLTGDIVTAMLGPIRICHITARAHLEQRLHQVESYAHAPFLKIVLQQRGTAYLQQGDRRTAIGTGSWSIYDASRPYSVQHVEALEQWSILIPREIRSPEIELAAGLVPEAPMALGGMSSILFNTARTALSEADVLEEGMREALGNEILELAKLVLFDQLGGASRIPMRETFRERVRRYVQQNLGDSDLSIDSIASALSCSKRNLHKGFAESGQTLNQLIWSERLERIRRDLASRTLADRSITEIAFNWGFVNSAHFSRRFNDRFGMSPRDFRKDALRESADHCDSRMPVAAE